MLIHNVYGFIFSNLKWPRKEILINKKKWYRQSIHVHCTIEKKKNKRKKNDGKVAYLEATVILRFAQ